MNTNRYIGLLTCFILIIIPPYLAAMITDSNYGSKYIHTQKGPFNPDKFPLYFCKIKSCYIYPDKKECQLCEKMKNNKKLTCSSFAFDVYPNRNSIETNFYAFKKKDNSNIQKIHELFYTSKKYQLWCKQVGCDKKSLHIENVSWKSYIKEIYLKNTLGNDKFAKIKMLCVPIEKKTVEKIKN